MSERVPPFLSASPPPFDEDGTACDDDDDFGDFHDFSSAVAVSSDTSITADSVTFVPVEAFDTTVDLNQSDTPDIVHPVGVLGTVSVTEKRLKFEGPNSEGNSDELNQFSTQPTSSAFHALTDNSKNGFCLSAQPEVANFASEDSVDVSVENTISSDPFETFSMPDCDVETSKNDVVENSSKLVGEVADKEHDFDKFSLKPDESLNPEVPKSIGEQDLNSCYSVVEETHVTKVEESISICTSAKDLQHEESCQLDTNIAVHLSDTDAAANAAADADWEDEFSSFAAVPPSPKTEVSPETLETSEVTANVIRDSESEDDFADFTAAPIAVTMTTEAPVDSSTSCFKSSASDEMKGSDIDSLSQSAATVHQLQHINDIEEGEDEFSNFKKVLSPALQPSLDDETIVDEVPDCVKIKDGEFSNAELAVDQLKIDSVFILPSRSSQNALNDQDSTGDDDFDEFEDFQSASKSEKKEPVVESSDGQWASFGEASNETDDDWAAFQEPVSISAAAAATSQEKSQDFPVTDISFSGSTQELLSRALTSCFQSHAEVSDSKTISSISSLQKMLNDFELQQGTDCNTNSSIERSAVIWNGLRVMENTVALKFQWAGSRTNDKLLKAVNVDARNILIGHRNKSSAPVFASSLGLLEPRKASVEHPRVVTNNIIPSSSTAYKTESQEGKRDSRFGQFDVKKPDRDLLDVLELSDKGLVGQGGSKTLPKPFENILASMTSSSKAPVSQVARKTTASAEPLSAEATAVLAHLPDLSFMHAKVLMFPVGDIAN